MSLLPYYQENTIEAGCDEAGRGCLAGPVVAAAAIMPADFSHPILNDSKQLSAKKREALVDVIKDAAIAWGIGVVDNLEIDEINILNASFLAMHRALDQLKVRPELLLIDGNRFNRYQDIPHETMIKGDGRFYSIAAASVLAKTYRDELMTQYATEYPQYAWERNAGYPTKAHRAAIHEYGATPLHRQSFRLLPEQLEIFN
ncbi:ribonuclease HII [Reichenbachiella sp. MSK19-1]|uniref:ribonuclease HII n=1 Tax=Reichenbachiella sp. MSK19-1 TaxID=1897631 RepID=UPI000E6C05B4|nr:ribonuclease HII [Reichenbachiella sp. MSK19-1]RJE74110.1 ribonuclease HII [Reichenbachiella sp. MSK19-1]